ncbi:MAG: 4-(cytidine 5'-diphospho)-2-C-methyl-D-erythritol kinase [Eubacterium sp.]|nr:4-(cytidine 5'-diphospho)-2-C-methyl-D-erythritol kinase [Eubacterium sp.]
MKVTVKAYAKINLLLDICALRKDGYHDLFMLMQSVGLYDTVTVERVKGRNITIFCDDSDVPTDEHNIAYKAAEAFFSDYKIRKTSRGLRITIQKRIPHAAGLAGGSADGAAVLTALNEIYGTGLTARELCATGVKIGADVPFCLTGGTLLSQGIGEILSPVKPLRRCYIVLAKPDQGVNTGAAFAQFDEFGKEHAPDCLGMLCAVQARDLQAIAARMENVFEQFIEVPERIYIKETMRSHGALGACMSGSGPTVFGLFENKADAEAAAAALSPLAKDIIVCTPRPSGCKIVKIEE